MRSFQFLGFISLLVIQCSIAISKHLKTGTLNSTETIDTSDGTMTYTTRAELRTPILVWQDLKNDGIRMTFCARSRGNVIRFKNVRDESDFHIGVVITFEREEYEALNCAGPPQNTELDKVDGIIFRKITFVETTSSNGVKYVYVQTEFVSGVTVCPTVQTTEIQNTAYATTRLRRTFSFTANSGAASGYGRIGANVDIFGGIYNFHFFRENLTYSWDQYIGATARTSVTLSGTLSRTHNFARIPLPSASFSGKNLLLIGKVSGGLFVTLGYDTSISLSQETTMTYAMGFRSTQRVYVGKNTFHSVSLAAEKTGTTNVNVLANIGSSVTNFAVTGFAGVKVGLMAELEMPWFKSNRANLSIAASVGATAKVERQYPPYSAVTSGFKLNSACNDCHSVQGTVNAVAKSLKIEGNIPGKTDPISRTILRSIASVPIGTVCLFPTSCNANNPS